MCTSMSARKAPPPKEIFHAATPINERAQVQFQTDMRRRILRAFVDAKEMLAYQHSGFSVGAGGQLNITRT